MHKVLRRLCENEIWFAVLAVGAGTLLPAWMPVALLLMLLFWPLRKAVYGRWTVRTPADLGILVLALLVPLNLWLSPLPDISTVQGFRLLAGIALYYSIANWAQGENQLKRAAAAVLPVALGLAVFSFFSVDWTLSKLPFLPAGIYDRFLLLVADIVHPNVLAGSLVVLLAFLAAGLLWGWEFLRRPVYLLFGLFLAGSVLVLLLTQSRGAFLALAAAGLVLVSLRWRWGVLVPILAVAGLVLVISLGNAQAVLDSLFAGAALDGFEGREEIWGRAVYLIQDFPLTGVGLGLYREAALRLYPFFPLGSEGAAHAHNLFLQVGVDLGIPGLIAWLSVNVLVFGSAWQVYRAGRRRGLPWLEGLGAGLLAAQAALAVHGLLDAVTWGMVRSAPLIWALWGLAAAGSLVAVKMTDGTLETV